MRLKWGPHRDRTPEQVLLRDPGYVLHVLDRQSAGRLAAVFRELVEAFDARPVRLACIICGGPAMNACAYPGSLELFGVCERCALGSRAGEVAPGATVLRGYEAALRHVASSFRAGVRSNMRRAIARLAVVKGGPAVATEAASLAFFSAGRSETAGVRWARVRPSSSRACSGRPGLERPHRRERSYPAPSGRGDPK